MLILLLSPQDRDDPKLGPWMSDLSQSNDIVVALYDKKNPNQIEQLFATAQAAGIPIEKISAAPPPPPVDGISGAVGALSAKIAELSQRQRDVLVLVADGLSNKVIAIQTGATLNSKEVTVDKEILNVIMNRIIKDINDVTSIKSLVHSNIDNCKKIIAQIEKSMLLMEFNQRYLIKFFADGTLSKEDLLDFYAGEEIKDRFRLIEKEINSLGA